MRNLKKVLSLALALVMLLGMMVVGAGAATSFSDADKIKNTEAVDVVSGIGVLLGDENGNFNPEGTLSRAEAAVVIAKLDLGAAFGNLETTNASTFSDVPAGYWGKPYIDYCFARGLIAGVGNNKYNPNGKVTGVEFALMVSRVLGYEDKAEQVGGADWEVEAAALARKAGLTVDVKLGSLPMTRDEMAQVAYNALKANMVEYKNGTIDITVGGTPVTIGGNPATPKAATGVHYDKSAKENDGILQLCEEKFPQLIVNAEEDNFARPVNVWTYKRKDIAEVPTAATAEYTKQTTSTAIKGDLNATLTADNVSLYIDGLEYTTKSDKLAAIKANTDNGVLTQAWYRSANDIRVTIINTYVGQVTSVHKATSTAKRSVTVTPYNNKAATSYPWFETEEFEVGDKVAYTVAWNAGDKVYDVQSAELLSNPITGTLTAWKGTGLYNPNAVGSSEGNFNIGSDNYKYSRQRTILNDSGTEPSNGLAEFSINETEINVYLDKFDYALLVEGVTAEKNYAVVVGVGSENAYGNSTYGATLLFPDGTTKAVKAEFGGADGDWTANGKNGGSNVVSDDIGDLVTYTVKSDGTYKLTIVPTTGKFDETYDDVANEIQFKNGRSTLILDDGANGADITLYTTSDTIFMVQVGDSFAAYTGYNAMPSIDENVVSNGIAYKLNDRYSNRVDVVFLSVPSLAGVSGVNTFFVKAKDATITTETIDGNKVRYYELPAVVNGEVDTIKVDAAATINKKAANGAANGSETLANSMEGLFVITNVVKDEKTGIITRFDDMTNVDATFDWSSATTRTSSGVTGTVRRSGDTIGLGWDGDPTHNPSSWRAYTEDTVVYTINEAYTTIEKGNVNGVVDDGNDLVYASSDGSTSQKKLKTLILVSKKESESNTNPGLEGVEANVQGSILEDFIISADTKPTNKQISALIKAYLNDSNVKDVVVTEQSPVDPDTKDVTITYNDSESKDQATVTLNVGAGKATGAEIMDKIQTAINAGTDKPDSTKVTITVEGNKMTLDPVANDNKYYTDPKGGVPGRKSEAVHDLARFLGKLYNEGALEITYNSIVYTWQDGNAVSGDSASQWYKKTGATAAKTDTLVGAITAAVGDASTGIANQDVNITLDVDDAEMIIVCKKGTP